MAGSADVTAASRSLAAVGLSEDEERAYLALLTLPGSTLPSLAHSLGYDHERTHMLLESLELEGLVSHSPGPATRDLPAPPQHAVEALIARRQEELAQTRQVLADLTQPARRGADVQTSRNNHGPLIEIITCCPSLILQTTPSLESQTWT